MAAVLVMIRIASEDHFLADLKDAFGDLASLVPEEIVSPLVLSRLGIRVDTIVYRAARGTDDAGMFAEMMFSDLPGHEGAIDDLGPRITDFFGGFTEANLDAPKWMLDRYGTRQAKKRRSDRASELLTKPEQPWHTFAGRGELYEEPAR